MRLFLDLDNTVTQSRGPISSEMITELSRFNPVIVSGASEVQMRKQLSDFECDLMPQNGNVWIVGGEKIHERLLNGQEREAILKHILTYSEIKDDMLEDRGCQIGFSLTGHNAPIEIKKSFDSDGSKRREILLKYPVGDNAIECRIGGTTTMDYFPKGLNKGTNILKFIENKGINRDDCLYIGDALFPNGNDETVVDVIKTFGVKNHLETLWFLRQLK